MKKTIAILAMLITSTFLAGCYVSNQDVGMVTGTVAGGAIGAGLSNGNPIATVGGAVIGGVIGNQVGRNWDNNYYYY